MLTIMVPLAKNDQFANDKDEWFLESLCELIDRDLATYGNGVEAWDFGPGEVGLMIFDGDPADVAAAITPLLKRHCPPGTRVEKFLEDESITEEQPLFLAGEPTPLEPIPTAHPSLEYKPYAIAHLKPPCRFRGKDACVFKAIAANAEATRQMLLEDASGREYNLEDQELDDCLTRLLEARYVQRHEAHAVVYEGQVSLRETTYRVTSEINRLLPKTASGKTSHHRDNAWDQVYPALFGLTSDDVVRDQMS